MTSQNHNDLIQTTNNNVIKIPYSDNQEESLIDTSIHINGFTIIELDEQKNDYNYLIQSYEEEQNIGKKEESQLQSKAESVENYYANYQDGVVPNVNCSKCLLGNFSSNELLYFKDRKTLISYLKYCFLYLKKSLFMNHFIYMNNKYDLFKINQSFYNGWKFAIPKTICKSCFIQMINIEFLIYNLKNIICDYDQGTSTLSWTNKNTTTNSLINNKRRRISKNKKRKIIKTKENTNINDKLNDINGQITPIVIPISENEKVHKKRRSTNSVFKRRKIKVVKRRNKTKYNENVIYDPKDNVLIINKKSIPNYQCDDDSIIINSIINDNKKFNINKEKEKENSKLNKKKEEKLKIFSNNKSETESLSHKKTVKKEKKHEHNSTENIKDINGNKNKNKNNNLNKNNNQKTIDAKSTIIINNINNNKNSEINMNKVGHIQINNNKFENNNLNNYSNKDYAIKNNIKQNNNNILINNLNNNNYNYNNNYLNYPNIPIIGQIQTINFNSIVQKMSDERQKLEIISQNSIYFTKKIKHNLIFGNIAQNIYDINNINPLLNYLEVIKNKLKETRIYFIYFLDNIKSLIICFQNSDNENNKAYTELIKQVNKLEEYASDVLNNYINITDILINNYKNLRQIVLSSIGKI